MTAIEARWTSWNGGGLEHLRLDVRADRVLADGWILGEDGAGRPFRASYVVECDGAWKARRARVQVLEDPARVLDLRSDGNGLWTDLGTGAPLRLIDGCIDVDIFPSPFTNTLPIRRLADAEPGRPVAIAVAWIAAPELTVRLSRQEYTLLARGAEGARWRYRGLDSDFTTELEVDRDGLVLDYPGLARRVR